MSLYVFNTERSDDQDRSMSCINHSLIKYQQSANESDTGYFVTLHNLIVQHEAYNAEWDYILDWNELQGWYAVHIIDKTL